MIGVERKSEHQSEMRSDEGTLRTQKQTTAIQFIKRDDSQASTNEIKLLTLDKENANPVETEAVETTIV